jgi:hypothetical protein
MITATSTDSLITKGTKLTTTNATAVYTNSVANGGSATQSTKLHDASICNTSASAVTITITWHDTSANVTYAIYSGYSLAANTTMLVTQALIFAPADELRVTAGTANVIEIVVTTTMGPSRGS